MTLSEIREHLQDTQAAIAQLERAIAEEPPESPTQSLLTTAKTLEKRRRELEANFVEKANRSGLDVCTYRLHADDHRPTIETVTGTLGSFRHLVSVVYDALKHGPKKRQRLGADTVIETAFEFGYTFAGSVGFVFTIPNERMLAGGFESDLDVTFQTMFDMSRASESGQLIDFAHKLGIASIRAMYQWASEHVKGDAGASIDWQRNRQIRASAVVQLPELENLRKVIGVTSEASVREITVHGVLLGADAEPRRFHFKPDRGDEIRGSYEDAINPALHPEMYKRYVATIEKSEVTHYATEEEDVKYRLLKLKDTGVRPYDQEAKKTDEEDEQGT